jgi:hypothetical protein
MDAADVVPLAGDELTGPERRVVQAAQTGALVDLRAGTAELDDPATGAAWDAGRTVRAEVLVELLTGARDPAAGQVRAIKLRGARITGQLDLEAAELGCPLQLWDCHVEQPVNVNEARAPVLRLPGCHMPGLVADQLETRGDLELGEGFTATGEVCLVGAHIGGQLVLDGAHLANPDGSPLTADGLTVDQAMFCGEGFTATGEVRLVGAHVGGQLDLRGARLANPNGRALAADRLSVDQHLFCGEGFTATGEVVLVGAHISGQLNFSGASLSNPDGRALYADGLTVDQGLVCGEGFTATGEVRLVGAHVGESLSFSGARLANPNGRALAADGLTVKHSMLCQQGFTATGEVRLVGAHIGGQLVLDGASLSNPDGSALNADGLTVDQAMFCREGFTATGEVRLVGAHVGGQLSFRGACLSNPEGLVALRLKGLRAVELVLLPRQRPDGIVDLTNARVGSLSDNPATWPDRHMLWLRGFTYETLENDQVSVRDRIGWVRRHPGGYTPQPYEQLAAAYRRAGRDDAARRVAVAKQWHRRSALGLLGKLWNWLLYVTVGYGYRTWLALVWLAALLVAGTSVFDRAYAAHQMVAAKQPAPVFSPVVYTLDRLLPIVNLGQRDAWIPQGAALRWSWVLTGAGWVLTTAVVAGLTGILKRD